MYNNNNYLIGFSSAILVFTLAIFAWNGYPILNGDSYNFLTTSIELKYQHTLTNPLFKFSTITDPSGLNRHVHYPPLFSYVVSYLMFFKSPSLAIYIALLIINVSNLLVFTIILVTISKHKKIKFVIVFFSTLSFATFLLSNNGRPENFGILLFLIAFACYLISKSFFPYLSGIILALLLFTGLVPFIYGFLLFLLALTRVNANFKTVVIAVVCFITTSIFIGSLLPYPIIDFVNGISAHIGRIVPGPFTIKRFLFYHITNANTLFFFVFMIVLVVCASYIFTKIVRSKVKLGTGLYVSWAAFLLLILCNIFLFRALGGVYNIYQLFPVYLLILLIYLDYSSMTYKIFIVLVALCSTSFLKHTILFAGYLSTHKTINQIQLLMNTKLNKSSKYCIDASLFLFFTNYENIVGTYARKKTDCINKIHFTNHIEVKHADYKIHIPSYIISLP